MFTAHTKKNKAVINDRKSATQTNFIHVKYEDSTTQTDTEEARK